MTKLNYRLLVLSILFSSAAYAGIGLSDWTANTPHGNNINNFSDGKTLYLKNGEELHWLAEWYFYNDFIVGRLGDKNRFGDTVGYFVVNESTYKIDTFTNVSTWTEYINQNKLKPKLWTRWFKYDWTSINSRLGYVFILGFYITVPIIILFCIVLFRAYKREGFNRKKPYTIVSIVVFGLGFITWLLGSFPQSW